VGKGGGTASFAHLKSKRWNGGFSAVQRNGVERRREGTKIKLEPKKEKTKENNQF